MERPTAGVETTRYNAWPITHPYEPQFRGPIGPLRHRCALPGCTATGPRVHDRCSCNVVRYCCSEHRIRHRPEHQDFHENIEGQRALVKAEDLKLRNLEHPGLQETMDFFERGAGWFLLRNTFSKDYVFRQTALAKHHLLPSNTLDGVQEALDIMMSLFKLSRHDLRMGYNMGIPNDIPLIMLRLDKDHEAYNLLRIYFNEDSRGNDIDTWGDFGEGPDWVHELDHDDVPDIGGDYRYDGSLELTFALLLLKLKVLIDIRNIRVVRKVSQQCPPLPVELWMLIEDYIPQSNITETMDLLQLSPNKLAEFETVLLRHVRTVGAKFAKMEGSSSFTHALFNPGKLLRSIPGNSAVTGFPPTRKNKRYSAWAFRTAYPAFRGTFGILDLLKEASELTGLADLHDSLAAATVDDNKEAPFDLGTCRWKERPPTGVRRLWNFIDYAIRDATFLGPRDERPSLKLMQRYEPRKSQ